MASKVYGRFLERALNKEIDFDSDDIRVMLVTSAYVPDQDTHTYLSSVVANEVAAGGGYTAGGLALTGKTLTYDAANNVTILDADDATWPSSTITARYAVIYDRTPGTDATRPLLAYYDFVTDQSSTNGNFVVQWDATGMIRATTA